MKLRDLVKMQTSNDGTRTLFESILGPEVIQALQDWRSATHANGVLIGGLGISFHVKPRQTEDVDYLFLSPSDIPEEVPGFKRTCRGTFQHNRTHVEVEVVVPAAINLPQIVAEEVFATAIQSDGYRVASPSGLVASN